MENRNIKEKLSLIQNELKAPKNQYNSFGKYKYRSCEDILEAVKPICNKYRATLTISDVVKQVGDRYYIEVTATLNDWDSENHINVVACAREEEAKKGMDSSQVTGATSSYARKYALNGLFNIDDTKDTDTEEHQSAKKEASKQAPKTKGGTEKHMKLAKIIDNMNANAEYKEKIKEVAQRVGTTKLTEFPDDEIEALYKMI